ncbi:hypothetical protein D5018_02185 [Parashewanella curva]|uniref:Tetratricopeptide repeat protein n=1 Tax=Parashewanella curva TaxID=2338552 RepID=A0A3L8Q2R9_9GAMM|nr:hypothetical protein [Parashewanella curva]RLV61308.1 hypothetical protein D5018_02185 [Parashewanella curva]
MAKASTAAEKYPEYQVVNINALKKIQTITIESSILGANFSRIYDKSSQGNITYFVSLGDIESQTITFEPVCDFHRAIDETNEVRLNVQRELSSPEISLIVPRQYLFNYIQPIKNKTCVRFLPIPQINLSLFDYQSNPDDSETINLEQTTEYIEQSSTYSKSENTAASAQSKTDNVADQQDNNFKESAEASLNPIKNRGFRISPSALNKHFNKSVSIGDNEQGASSVADLANRSEVTTQNQIVLSGKEVKECSNPEPNAPFEIESTKLAPETKSSEPLSHTSSDALLESEYEDNYELGELEESNLDDEFDFAHLFDETKSSENSMMVPINVSEVGERLKVTIEPQVMHYELPLERLQQLLHAEYFDEFIHIVIHSVKPDDTRVLLMLAYALLKTSKTPQSIKLLNYCIQSKLAHPTTLIWAHYYLGDAYQLKDKLQSIFHFQRAFECSEGVTLSTGWIFGEDDNKPINRKLFLFKQGGIHVELFELEQAKGCFIRCIESKETVKNNTECAALIQLSKVYLMANCYHLTIECSQRALTFEDISLDFRVTALSYQLIAYSRSMQTEQAALCFKSLSEQEKLILSSDQAITKPAFLIWARAIGEYWLSLREYEKMRQQQDDMLGCGVFREDVFLRDQSYFFIGEHYLNCGQPDRAVPHYSEVLRSYLISPSCKALKLQARLNRGKSYLQLIPRTITKTEDKKHAYHGLKDLNKARKSCLELYGAIQYPSKPNCTLEDKFKFGFIRETTTQTIYAHYVIGNPESTQVMLAMFNLSTKLRMAVCICSMVEHESTSSALPILSACVEEKSASSVIDFNELIECEHTDVLDGYINTQVKAPLVVLFLSDYALCCWEVSEKQRFHFSAPILGAMRFGRQNTLSEFIASLDKLNQSQFCRFPLPYDLLQITLESIGKLLSEMLKQGVFKTREPLTLVVDECCTSVPFEILIDHIATDELTPFMHPFIRYIPSIMTYHHFKDDCDVRVLTGSVVAGISQLNIRGEHYYQSEDICRLLQTKLTPLSSGEFAERASNASLIHLTNHYTSGGELLFSMPQLKSGDEGTKAGAIDIFSLSQWKSLRLQMPLVVITGQKVPQVSFSDVDRDPMSLADRLLLSGAGAILAPRWELNAKQKEYFFLFFYAQVSRGRSTLDSQHQASIWFRVISHPSSQDWACYQYIGKNITYIPEPLLLEFLQASASHAPETLKIQRLLNQLQCNNSSCLLLLSGERAGDITTICHEYISAYYQKYAAGIYWIRANVGNAELTIQLKQIERSQRCEGRILIVIDMISDVIELSLLQQKIKLAKLESDCDVLVLADKALVTEHNIDAVVSSPLSTEQTVLRISLALSNQACFEYSRELRAQLWLFSEKLQGRLAWVNHTELMIHKVSPKNLEQAVALFDTIISQLEKPANTDKENSEAVSLVTRYSGQIQCLFRLQGNTPESEEVIIKLSQKLIALENKASDKTADLAGQVFEYLIEQGYLRRALDFNVRLSVIHPKRWQLAPWCLCTDHEVNYDVLTQLHREYVEDKTSDTFVLWLTRRFD